MIFILVALFCVIVPWVVGERYGVLRLVSPMHVSAYMAFAGILVKSIYWQIFGGDIYFLNYNVTAESIFNGYAYIACFMMMLCLGYVLAIRKAEIRLSEFVNRSMNWGFRPGVLFILSSVTIVVVADALLGARGFSIRDIISLEAFDQLNSRKVLRIEGVEGFGASQSAVKALLIIPTAALGLCLFQLLVRPGLKTVGYFCAFFLLEVIAVGLTAKRFALVDVLFLFVFCFVWHHKYANKRMQWMSLAYILKLCVVVGMLAVLFVYMTNLRLSREETKKVNLELTDPIEQVLSSTYFMDINVPIVVIERTPGLEKFHGTTYFYWSFGWIPRDFWPEKPAITLGPYVKQYVFGLTGTVGGIVPTGPGEAFLNFGYWGMFVGLFLGAAYRKLEEFVLLGWVNERGRALIYPLCVFPFVVGTLQSSFSATFVSNVVAACIFLILLRVVVRSNPLRNWRKNRFGKWQNVRRVRAKDY